VVTVKTNEKGRVVSDGKRYRLKTGLQYEQEALSFLL